MHRLGAAILFLAVAWLVIPGRAAFAAPEPVAARVSMSGKTLTVQLKSANAMRARAFLMTAPHRFVVDVVDAEVALRGGADVSVKARVGRRPNGSGRLVLEFDAPAKIVSQKDLQDGRTQAWTIEIAQPPTATKPAPAKKAQRAETAPTKVERATAPDDVSAKRHIVIDAGHGGKDPGAIGVTGVREKEIVLAAALSLKTQLEKRGYRVSLTRDGDSFIELPDRVAFARNRNADLFVSLHADSHGDARAAGASVYTLSEHGGARAKSVAGAQNWQMDFGDARRASTVEKILLDLAQRETVNRSATFAETLIKELGRTGPLLRRTHRNAGFFVLLAPDVPAVLVELGFLTNAGDEARLSDASERAALAGSIADAIDVYFAAPRAYAENAAGR